MTEEQKARLAELRKKHRPAPVEEEPVSDNYWDIYFAEVAKQEAEWVNDHVDVRYNTGNFYVALKSGDFATSEAEAREFAVDLFREFASRFTRGPIG